MKNPVSDGCSAALQRKKTLALPRVDKDLVCALPGDHRLSDLLGFAASPAAGLLLAEALLRPIGDLISNRGKQVRAQLVSFSYRLLSGDHVPSANAVKRCRSCADVIELIHAGSLIVDDIEDGSQMRRGRPALHVRYGMPAALNAGNWLYFWPFELLKEAGFAEGDLVIVYEKYQRTLLRAHYGQALDLGTRVDSLPQNEVTDVCLAAMRLKTGALMGFAAFLGATLADGSETLMAALDDFGRDLGVALQMFDDLGNVIGRCEPAKRYEDLTLSRPSWVWACAAQTSSPEDYGQFIAAARKLPDTAELDHWLARHRVVDETRQSARAHLDRSFEKLKECLNAERARWSARVFDDLCALGEAIAVAYG